MDLRKEFLRQALYSVDELIEIYKDKIDNDENIETVQCEFLEKYLAKAIDILKEAGIEDVDLKIFSEEYYLKKYCYINNSTSEEKETLLLSEESNLELDLIKSTIVEKLDENNIPQEKKPSIEENIYLTVKSIFNIPFDITNILNEHKSENRECNNGVTVEDKKIIKIGVIIAAILIAVYLFITLFFSNKFYFGSKINGVDVQLKTPEEAQSLLMQKSKDYTLRIEERDKVVEEICSSDINLNYSFDREIYELKERQNPFLWVKGIFLKTEYEINHGISYDEDLFREATSKLQCFNEEKLIYPNNAGLEYSNGNYQIIKEIMGNITKTEKLNQEIIKAIKNTKGKINLEELDCYENPKFTSQSKEVIEAKNIADKYVSSIITYEDGGKTQILDGETINTWINIDDDFNVLLDDKKIIKYINTLGNTYDNLGNVREFVKPSGDILKVSTSSDISFVDREKEKEELINLVKEGGRITKKPNYTYSTTSNLDSYVVNTFVEIDLSNQHIWYYKNGQLITEGNIVTGDVSRNYATPPGVFGLTYKQRDATLKGPGYSTPVSFWMPFNGGIGIHDATWRGSFGGSIYKTNGSHGCINAPYSVAEAIFNSIEQGNIIICRY